MPRVLVIGGGVAGLAAGLFLSRAGYAVTLLEAGRRLGGRASSGMLPGFGEVDLGFHVLMRTCVLARRFLGLLGAEGDVSFQRRLEVPLWIGGRIVWVRSHALFHLVPALLRLPSLSLRERAGLIRLLSALRPPMDVTATEWLRRIRISSRAVDLLLKPLLLAALNGDPREVSAPYAAMVVRRALLSLRGGALGFFRVPMSRIWARVVPPLERAGGEVHLEARVTGILLHRGKAIGVRLTGGEEITGTAVIAALPPQELLDLLPEDARDFLEPAKGIPWSPIVCVHLLFAKPILPLPFLFTPGLALQAVFSVSRLQGKDGPEHVVLVQSGARDWIERPLAEVREELLGCLQRVVPQVGSTKLLSAYVLRFPQATFLPAPEVEGLRPQVVTPIPGLFLAGDFVRTGWPSTLEGAIRSGLMAAEALTRIGGPPRGRIIGGKLFGSAVVPPGNAAPWASCPP